jgi:hypothetical protein
VDEADNENQTESGGSSTGSTDLCGFHPGKDFTCHIVSGNRDRNSSTTESVNGTLLCDSEFITADTLLIIALRRIRMSSLLLNLIRLFYKHGYKHKLFFIPKPNNYYL